MGENKAKDSSRSLLIPLTTEDVTADWFEKILDIKIDRDSFSVTGNANAGVGFLSNLVRVRFEEISSDGNKKEHCVVAKLLPVQEIEHQLVLADKMDKSELHLYQKLLPELLEEIPSLEEYFCPMIYGGTQEEDLENNIPYASVLVLKDLKADGYILKPFGSEELSHEEICLGLDFLAKFHAAGALLELKKQSPLSKVYSHIFPEWYYPNERKDKPFVYHTWFIDGFDHSIELLNNYAATIDPSAENSVKEINSKFLEPLAPYAQKIFNQFLKAGQLFPSLVHGDLWQNNMLVLLGNPTSIKVIDWQMTGYTDSVNDLAILVLSSLYPNITLEKFERNSKIYFDRLETIYSELEKNGRDLSGIRRRSWPEFWEALKTYGATFMFIVHVMSSIQIKSVPSYLPKVYAAFRFFYYDLGLAEFLTKIVKQ